MYDNLWRVMFAPDAEGAGGEAESAGDGAGGAAAGSDNAGKSGAPSGQAATKEASEKAAANGVQRPEWLAEKYWSEEKFVKDGKLNYEAIAQETAKAHAAAEQKIFTRKDHLKEEVRKELQEERSAKAPKTPDDYQVRIPDRYMEGNISVEIDNDGAFQVFKQAAHEFGVPQDRFDELVAAYIDSRVAELPNSEQEIRDMGEHGELRVDRIRSWAARELSKENYEFISTLPVTKRFTEFLENVMELTGLPKFTINEDTGTYVGDISKEEVTKLMNSPEYLNGDRDTHNKVKAYWQRLSKRNSRAG